MAWRSRSRFTVFTADGSFIVFKAEFAHVSSERLLLFPNGKFQPTY